MIYQLLKPEFLHSDGRGSLIQLVSGGYMQVNILVSKAGVERGGHYHKSCSEAFYIIRGKVEILLEKDGETEECVFVEGDFFRIEPWTVHRMRFPEECVMAALYDHPVEMPEGKDIYPYERER